MNIGNAIFDSGQGTLIDTSGKDIPLRPQSLDVLKTLARWPGEIVPKETLMDEVWGDLAVTDDSLTQCIADIRKALDDRGRKIVQTVPKKGYRLLAQPETKADAPRPHIGRMATGLAALLVVALLGAWGIYRTQAADLNSAGTETVAQVTRSEPSIAVLPFQSIESDERWTRLGRGLAADIANELARNEGLYVTLPESLMNVAFGDVPPTPDLNVRFVLGGTIQAQDEEIRISAQLTDAGTAKILWSEIWTGPKNDIFAVQDQIIHRINGNLASTFSGVFVQEDLKHARLKLTEDLDAYEHYIIGFEFFHNFGPEKLLLAIEHLEAALEIDPSFAAAMVPLSMALLNQADEIDKERSQSLVEASQALAYRAFSIEPNNPNVLWRTALAYALDGQYESGQTLLHRAVKIAPNNADVLLISAEFADDVGVHGPEPLAWAERALELNPMAPSWWYGPLGDVAFGAGEYERAIETIKAQNPDGHGWLFIALSEVQLGNMPEARRAAEQFRKLEPHMSIEAIANGTEADRPDQHRIFEGARLLGLPITDEDLELANAQSNVLNPTDN